MSFELIVGILALFGSAALGLPVAFAILVLQLTTPVAVTSYLLAEKYGADAQSVAGLVVVSSLMSVLSLPVLITILL